MTEPRTYQGVLYLQPDGLVDQNGKVVLSKDELLAQLVGVRSESSGATLHNAAAELVPTTWLDPLLSGPDAVLKGSGPWGCPDIERLLRAVRDRIVAAPEAP